jgi:hypothetical protein
MFQPPPFAHPLPGAFPGASVGFAAPDEAALDELIASATRPPPKAADEGKRDDGRKDEGKRAEDGKKASNKDKNSKMVYSDNDVSPEEKIASLLRFAG